ncbi:GTPase IMAP family member 4 isoform X2 [Astyanax mexicanus]|uniref:GTPase IMAP family member 4 isoform X2 n=1 Tax=Astyanax mexicanus TaxID=7994 RepID=UPI0020CB157F|nr:GTPase IMAP family member 4 isoform X2 [Astyanax mexicanus]
MMGLLILTFLDFIRLWTLFFGLCPLDIKAYTPLSLSLFLIPLLISADEQDMASSSVRILLLGKDCKANRRVGNFILGRDAFNTEIPPHCSQGATENVEGRGITLIITPDLFDPELTNDELNDRVSECMTLCAPGPHVIVLVLQRDDFTEADRKQLNFIFRSLSEEARKHTIVLTQRSSSVDPFKETVSNEITAEFSKWHFDFISGCSQTAVVELMEKRIEENGGGHYMWEEFVMAPLATEEQQHQQSSAQSMAEQAVQKMTGK